MKLTYNGYPLRILTWKDRKGTQSLWHYSVEYLKDDEWHKWFCDVDYGMFRWEAKNKAKRVIRMKLGLSGKREKKATYL